jgi:hypothetical protein
MRSFGLVDQKLEEADFFCDRVAESGRSFFSAQCYFSAFVAAARSVTFALQGSIKDLPGFTDWYSRWQDRMRKDKLARFFHECRTDSQHLGLNPVMGGASGNGEHYHFFGQPEYGRYDWLPELDVASACREYMRTICQLIEDCYDRFGHEIDPDRIYTHEGLKAKGWTLEDVEEQLGFPRGWTDIGDDPDKNDHRLKALRKEIAMPTIRLLIRKYLDAPPSDPVFGNPVAQAIRNLSRQPSDNPMDTKVSFIQSIGETIDKNQSGE